MTYEYSSERSQLLEIIRNACEVDLLRISAGNVSTRTPDGLVLITPSGISYQNITEEDLSIVDLDGNLISGPLPSSENPMHTTIYREIPRAISICHTHSKFGMVFAMLGEDVPLMSIELMVCGAPIPTAPWATPGTIQGGEVTVDLFRSREDLNVILLRQHGLVAIGESLEQAFERAYNAEVGLEVYYKARLLGDPRPFSAEQLRGIREAYG
jgi:L-fuculose-phosphate aldolase